MTYRERREARAARLRGWAEKRDARSDRAFDRARAIGDNIPLGQPILIGHHSEGRHRRDLERMDSAMRDAVESEKKAASMRSRADNIEAAAEHAIYSDDEDAIPRLRERVAALEAERERVKAYNASCRKGAPDLELLDERQRAQIASCLRVGFGGKKGSFPTYHLRNLGGNITRQRNRLRALEAWAAREAKRLEAEAPNATEAGP